MRKINMNDDSKEALNNLINSIQEKMNINESSQEEKDNNNSFDISSILNSFNQNKEDNSNSNNNDNNFTFDPSIILKMQKIIGSMNNNNPKKELLLSLKPFLRKSRQDKMNDYLTILNVISALEALKNKDSD